ncbi:MAG: uroporphyrinogen decarboxylase [Planctomycetaceae bacterium]|nr:uroporphyrinogen decarboxylase [Planctomycetaceae bacterium]
MSEKQATFAGLQVAAFESRRAEETARMIERFGGEAYVSPSMREVPLESSPAVVHFANELVTGQIDIVILMTGVGYRHLVSLVERHLDRERFLNSLADVTTIARGPKPVIAMRETGLTPTFVAPEPNTWRELLGTLDQNLSLANLKVGLQEYGKANPSLVAGLEARGAEVMNLRVYAWDLPLDTKPLEDNLRRLVERQLDVCLFTSAHQVTNLLKMAVELGICEEVTKGLRQTVVASVGPTTSEMLRRHNLPVDFEPSHPKLGHLVAETAGQSQAIRSRKQRVRVALDQAESSGALSEAPWFDSPFMKACRGEPTDVTPVWLMRQAGRYMEEYREVRAKTTFLDLCKNPQLCSEVMVTAVQRLGVDAAIIFSDLLPMLQPMGLDLEYVAGDGPVIHNPVREPMDVDRVMELDNVESLDFVMQTVRQTRLDLPDDMPLIGFAGAPFTLASYVIEGGSSRSYVHTKTLMFRDPGAWQELMERMSRSVTIYLNAQIAAGAQCVQLFDSWVGCLSPADYRQFVLPYVQQIIRDILPGVPVISFATGNPALLPLVAEGGAPVIGLDWRIDLAKGWEQVGFDRSVQGNLDPGVLLSDRDTIRRRAKQVLQQADGRPGHIFNLGHGILKETPVDNAIALVDIVHELSQRS